MKITITQPEIHQAIEAFIRGQISINEGMKVEINLRATRGEDGATAEIDIVPDQPEPAPEPVKATRAPRQPKATTDATSPTTAPNVGKTSKPLEVAEDTAGKANANVARSINDAPTADVAEEAAIIDANAPVDEPEPNSEEALAAEAAATEPEERAQDEAAPARTSLFGGLKKPVN